VCIGANNPRTPISTQYATNHVRRRTKSGWGECGFGLKKGADFADSLGAAGTLTVSGGSEMKRIALLVVVIGLVASACSASVLKLSIGTCFDDPESFESVEDVPIVDCGTPHDNEVFANVDLTGDNYPGNEAVQNRALQVCETNFSAYVAIEYSSSIYDIGYLNPTSESWSAGDREVICFAYALDLSKITGSINGIAE